MLKWVDMRLYPCRCCGEARITQGLSVLLRTLDGALARRGRAVRVNSGYRCAVHNSRVGGVTNSRHMTGEAADLHPVFPESFTPGELAHLIEDELGTGADGYAGGLGVYGWGCHLDIGKRSRWRG